MVMKIFFMDWVSVNLIRGYKKCEIFARIINRQYEERSNHR